MSNVESFSHSPQRDPPYDNTAESWAVPIGTLGGLRLYLSHSVFGAAAVLIALLVMTQGREGTADLPWITLVGVAFWMTGWLVQVAVHAFARFAFSTPIESLSIGLLGVESRCREWDSRSALLVSVVSLLGLVSTGAMMVVAEQALNGTRPLDTILGVWSAPAFGLRNSEFVWLAGAWLLWVQAVCQMYPLPKSLGRVAIVASISLVAARFQEVFQTHFARRAIQLCALASGMFAIVSIMLDPADFSPRWPLLMLLSLVLWVTSLGPDIREMVIGFGDFSGWNDGELMNPKPNRQTGSWLDNAKTSVVSMSRRRKLRQVMQREKQEADDIGRLDEVLNQLHTQGRDSLSSEDLALLNRVSESLRKERELEPK